MLRIALPNKGRLAEDVRGVFADAGLEIRASGDRALTASLGGEFEAIFVRSQDIPELVSDGIADAGVTGWDLVCETGRPVDVRLDLEFGRCRLVLATRDDAGIERAEQLPSGTRAATVFPRLARAFFAEKGLAVEVIPVSGAAEVAPHLGIADVVVDLTSTGSTLRTNGLKEICTLLESTARLVARPGLAGEQARALAELQDALASVLRARGKRYLMANVPRTKLEAVREVLPGLNGPTVVELYGAGPLVAVHAVVAESSLYRTVAALKALGGEGILVTRIERLLP
ncbi:MAG TPA: ATP phosphoribosyltransferase [Myxococcaceae bacterium]|jgi:ATP phosphoribosyltransferase